MTTLSSRTNLVDPTSNANAENGLLALFDVINEFSEKAELDIASAATCDIGAQISTKLRITGTTTITSFGVVYRGPILLRMSGALTITHNATSLLAPFGASFVTAAGDVLLAYPKTTTSGTSDGWQVVLIYRTSAAAERTAIGAAALASPTFTGTPAAPTAAVDTNTTQLATTAFVLAQASSTTPVVATLTGSVGTDKRYALSNHAHPIAPISSFARVATTSTALISLTTAIPAWVKRIMLMFSQVSTIGTSPILIQIGDSGGIETSGYTAGYGNNNTSGSAGAAVSSAGFIIPGIAAGDIRTGTLVLTLQDAATNVWTASGNFYVSPTQVGFCGGDKSLSATLTRISVTTAGGTDTFDNGSIGILYE